jgi:hypothetical protein
MKKIVTIVASAVMMLGFALVPALPTKAAVDCSVDATSPVEQTACAACAAESDENTFSGGVCTRMSGGKEQKGVEGLIQTVINILLFIIGILSVIMIIFGGIKYTTSAGDKSKVDSAKNTIMYAVVGLVVSIVAFALVQWVFNSLVK